ncbi:YjfB family protein [Thalassobacillus sp. CUG 92003]|uniref:YjfB family protein n=1 Tax=Thalassobacillus sp. CUG 92003 TaxID=2736641 RepID=UPI0015E72C34|nr:YjfB family protein [Thalassobacillus sp. CUG 92003]
MDIAATSIAMSNMKLKQDTSVALMDKSIDQAKTHGNQLVEMLDKSTSAPQHPSLGNHLDLKG